MYKKCEQTRINVDEKLAHENRLNMLKCKFKPQGDAMHSF